MQSQHQNIDIIIILSLKNFFRDQIFQIIPEVPEVFGIQDILKDR